MFPESLPHNVAVFIFFLDTCIAQCPILLAVFSSELSSSSSSNRQSSPANLQVLSKT